MTAARVALVTGSSSGFGLLSAVALAKAGHRVVATLRDPARATAVADAARAAGVELDVQRLDVTDGTTVAACRDYVADRYGRLDVLVNNAGYALVGPMEDVPLAALRLELETNLFGVIEVTRAFLPLMRAAGAARIINLSSAAGRTTIPLMTPYHTTKWALEGLSEAWRYELAPFAITVVLVQPGSFRTDFDGRSMVRVEDASASRYGAIIRRMEAARPVIHRLAGDPRRVARVVVRAATARRPRLRYIVGFDAWLAALGRSILPGKAFTWLTARVFRIPTRL